MARISGHFGLTLWSFYISFLAPVNYNASQKNRGYSLLHQQKWTTEIAPRVI